MQIAAQWSLQIKFKRQGVLRLSVFPTLFAAGLLAFGGSTAAAATPASTPAPATFETRGLETEVQFWLRIYTQVTTREGLLHDERNLGVVYDKLVLPPDNNARDRQQASDDGKARFASVLRSLADQFDAAAEGGFAVAVGEVAPPLPRVVVIEKLADEERRILKLWGERAATSQLRDAAETVRFQLGQSDRFRAGLIRSGAWETHIAETLANTGVPMELAALPHVESSFDPTAYSKVGASGLWQFMRSTGRRYMRVDEAVDERLDPFRATEAAAQLLAYNQRVLGSWPLAITAYNHGAGGMRRAQQELGTSDPAIIAHQYQGPGFGFASRNFFPSFLAAMTIARDPEKYFGKLERASEIHFVEIPLPGFVSFSALQHATEMSGDSLRTLNPALRPAALNDELLLPSGYRLRLPPDSRIQSALALAQRIEPSEWFAGQIETRSLIAKRGDTLSKIARRAGFKVERLVALNGSKANVRLARGSPVRLPDVRPAPLSIDVVLAVAAASRATIVAPPVNAVTVTAQGPPAELPTDPQQIADQFFEKHRIVGTQIYVTRPGDTLASVADAFADVPLWLLREYNPDAGEGELPAGMAVSVPRVE